MTGSRAGPYPSDDDYKHRYDSEDERRNGFVAEKLAAATDARAKGRTATDAARLVGWSRATLYRHQAQAARLSHGQTSVE